MSKPAARVGDEVEHRLPPILVGGPGSPNVFIGGLPAWRGNKDIHQCVTPPLHGPGMVIDGSSKVLINGLPACRVGDTIMEACGLPNKITGGCPTVLIGS